MPLVRIEMLTGRSRVQKKRLVEVITREMARIVECSPLAIQVVISEVEKCDWAVGGVLNDEPTDEASQFEQGQE